MKNRRKYWILLLALLGIALLLCSCGKKVTFDPDGGEIVSGEAEQIYDGKTPVTAPEVARDGYRFMGWNGDYATPSASVTATAKWEKLYTVTFDPDGGTVTNGVSCVQEVIAGEEVRYPGVAKAGYAFDAWDADRKTVDADTVIKASWRRLYTVTFRIGNGKADDPSQLVQYIPEGDAAKAPKVSMEYMMLDSWDGDFDCVKADTVVTAKWVHRVLDSSEMFRYINPATVEIASYRYQDVKYATGSGFFLTSDGEIVTNFHVIENALRLTAKTSDGKEYEVKSILAYDESKDLAILKIDAVNTQILDFTAKPVVTGNTVFAIGSSQGLTGTFSTGIISAAARELEGATYIQTTAQISSGNSGGPLVDDTGCVIGVNTLSIVNGQNLNFAIPVGEIAKLKRQAVGVDEWSKKLGFTDYQFREHTVKETDGSAEYSCQVIGNGDTVEATLAAGGDLDYYSLKSSELIAKYGKNAVVDVLYCLYTDSTELVREASDYMGLFSLNMRTHDAAELPVEYYYTVERVGNGYLMSFYLHNVLILDDGVTVPALQVAGELTRDGKYEVFIYAGLCDEECPTKTGEFGN